MRERIGLSLALVSLALCCRSEQCVGAYETVTGSAVVCFNAWQIGTDYLAPVDSLVSENSFPSGDYYQTEFTVGWIAYGVLAQPTIDDAVDALCMSTSIAAWNGHGAPDGALAIEWYWTEYDRNIAYSFYCQEYGEDVDIKTFEYGGEAYAIAILPALISSKSSYTDRTFLVVDACYGSSGIASWGAGAHVSYADTMEFPTMQSYLSTICHRLAGKSGREERSSGLVVSGIPCSAVGRSDLVLNPAVREMYPSLDAEIDCDMQGYVEFDSCVDVYGLQYVLASQQYWSEEGLNPIFEFRDVELHSDTLLVFTLHPQYQSPACITVDAFEIQGLESTDGLLNGNSDPPGSFTPWGPNCYPPDGDDYVTRYESIAGESPAASVLYFAAIAVAGGVDIRWETANERDSDCFAVYRSTNMEEWECVSDPIPCTAGAGAGAAYEWFDAAGGMTHVYKLLETELDGDACWHPAAGSQEQWEPLRLSEPPRRRQRVITTTASPVRKGLGAESGNRTEDPDALIIFPAEWLDQVQLLSDHWVAHRGISSPLLVPLESLAAEPTDQDVKDFIITVASSVEYVLLVGDTHADLPECDVCPGHYVDYPAGYWADYFAWDGWFGDLNDDGLAEIAVSRLPALCEEDVAAQVAKSVAYDGDPGEPWRRSSLWMLEDRSIGGLSPAWLCELAEAARDSLPETMGAYTLAVTDVPGHENYENLEAAGLSAWDTGHQLVFGMGTASTPWSFLGFFNTHLGFDVEELQSNGACPIVVGASCGMATHYFGCRSGSAPIVDLFQKAEAKGSVAWLGFSDATDQWLCYVMCREFIERLDESGSMSLGQIWVEMCEEATAKYPEHAELIQLWVLVGDPTLRVRWTDVATNVPGAQPGEGGAASLAVSPNPAGPGGAVLHVRARAGTYAHLTVYTVGGRLVRTLLDGVVGSEDVRLVWDGQDDSGRRVSTGVYFARLATEEGILTKKVALIR